MTMNSEYTLRNGSEEELSAPPLQMELALAYEDIATALRARCAVERVLSHLKVNAHPAIHLWKLDLLRNPEFKARAAREAADADILMVSLHGRNRLAHEAEAALKEWVDVERSKPCALVISLDADAQPTARTNPTVAELHSAATRRGVTVLLQFAEPWHDRVELALAGIRYRADTKTHVLDNILYRPLRPAPWGINE